MKTVLISLKSIDWPLTLNVVAVPKTAELLLASSVPDVESEGATVGVEDEGVNLDSQCGDVFLLELTSQVALDEGCLADTTVADKHQLESGHFLVCHRDFPSV